MRRVTSSRLIILYSTRGGMKRSSRRKKQKGTKMDRDQIIKGLESCATDNSCYEGRCPYKSDRLTACTTKMSSDALALINELTEENERLMRDKTSLECIVATVRNQSKADTVKKTIDAIKSKGVRNAYSCMISGNMRETYTIKASDLDDIEKEMLEDERPR